VTGALACIVLWLWLRLVAGSGLYIEKGERSCSKFRQEQQGVKRDPKICTG
jgi:hypothetical protein